MHITLQLLHTVCSFSFQSITYQQKMLIMFHVRSITGQRVRLDIALHHEIWDGPATFLLDWSKCSSSNEHKFNHICRAYYSISRGLCKKIHLMINFRTKIKIKPDDNHKCLIQFFSFYLILFIYISTVPVARWAENVYVKLETTSSLQNACIQMKAHLLHVKC